MIRGLGGCTAQCRPADTKAEVLLFRLEHQQLFGDAGYFVTAEEEREVFAFRP